MVLFAIEPFLSRPPPPHRRYAAGFRWVVRLIVGSVFPSNGFSPRFPGFIARPFRGVGVGFEEPHIRLIIMVYFVEPELLRISHNSEYICDSSGWASVKSWPWKAGNYLIR